MKKTTLVISLTIVFIALFYGCTKNEDKSFDSAILINHTWKVTEFTINPAIDFDEDGTLDTNPYEMLYGSDCWQNNFVTFNADFTGHYDQVCGEMLQDFTWSFAENNTKLKVGTQLMEIIQLDDIHFIVTYDIDVDGINHKETLTYTAR
jgi:hypothetical protein